MRGQLWEECPRCDTDPVCVDCGYCRRHCECAQVDEDRKQAREFNKAYPGAARAVSEHLEDGAREN